MSLDRAEGVASRLADALRSPPLYAALVAAIVLLGLSVRLALVPDADDIFHGEVPDGKQYFANAYGLFLHGKGFLEPFAHRGDGWSLLLAGAMKLFGFEGTAGFTMAMDAPFDAEGEAAIRFAYAFHAVVAAAIVPATWLLARLLVGRLTSAAAALIVAVDPFLLDQSTTVMADQPFALLILLALACVVKARDHPAWLAGAGALVALSHMARMNGILFLGTIGLFAAVYLPRVSPRYRHRHLAYVLVAFLVVASPYLLWRDHYLPHAFDYGTNSRFWTDNPWDMDDAYWQSYTYSGGGVRETAADYFATHTWGEALARLYHSGQWQLLDLTRVTLTPLLLLLGVTGMAASRREAWAPMTPLVGLTLAATFFWVYPVVRSPRYFLVLIPLFAILAAMGARHAATATRRVALAFASILGPYFVTYGIEPILRAPRALALAGDPYVVPMVVVSTCALLLGVGLVCSWRDLRGLIVRTPSRFAPDRAP